MKNALRAPMRNALGALGALLVLGGCGIYGPPERPKAAPPEAQAAPDGTGAPDGERQDGEKPK